MRSTKLLIVLFFAIVTLVSCNTKDYSILQEENTQLKARLANLEAEKDKINTKLLQAEDGLKGNNVVPSIMYSDYKYKKRLIMSEVALHIYAGSNAPVVNKISPNTAVEVLDAGLINGEDLWLYIEMPVYDIPAHFKGWIREDETIALTEENKKLAYDSVFIKKATEIYNCFDFEDIAKIKAEKLPNDVNGRIEAVKSGYVRIFCAGGWDFWVKEDNVVYSFDNP